MAVHSLPLRHAEEAFAGGVVGAVDDRGHAAHQGVSAEELLIRAADELATAIGVQDDLRASLPLLPFNVLLTAYPKHSQKYLQTPAFWSTTQ